MAAPKLCARCEFRNPPGFRFCGQCGAPLSAAPPERRQLTVLFCDLVGSTALSERLDEEDLRELVAEYHALAEKAFTGRGGYIGQFLGDGLLVYFGWPHALENAAAEAVRGGLDLLQAVAARNAAIGRRGTRFQIRIAIHTGPVIVGELGAGGRREQAGIVGLTSNLTARLQSLAPVGALVMSDAARRLVPDLFTVEELGYLPLKGIARPVRACQVLGLRTLPSGAFAPERAELVGRGAVLASLAQAWRAVRAGSGRVLALRGEAGSEKSRLVREFHRTVGKEPHRWLPAQASEATRHSSFLPIFELGRRLGLGGAVSAAEHFTTIAERLAEIGLTDDDAVILALFSGASLPEGVAAPVLAPEALRARAIALLVEVLRRRARQMPVIFLFEDLHWADASTLEFMHALIDGGVPPGVLVLTTARPEFQARWAEEALTLERFTAAEATQLVESVAGRRWLSAARLVEIVRWGDGVPLYLEEITRALIEAGWADSTAPGGSLPPMTLRDSLRARLDLLGAAGTVAQLAAVIGRDFREELLRALWPGDAAELSAHLERLVAAGILARSQAGYAFRHALIQAEAYEAMLVRTRREHHRRLADLLEKHIDWHYELAPEMLAHHFTLAGRAQRAIPLWRQAAKLAASRHAHVEATAHLQRALELLRALPRGRARDFTELEILLALGASLAASTGYGSTEIEVTAQRLLRLEALPMTIPQAAHLHGIVAASALARHRWEIGGTMAQWFIETGRAHGIRSIEGSGELYRGIGGYYRGGLAEADLAWEFASRWCEADHVFALNNQLAAEGWRSLCLCLCGKTEESRALLEGAKARAAALQRPNNIGFIMQIEQSHRMYHGDAAAIMRDAPAFTAFMKEQGLSHWLAMTVPIQGWAAVYCGQVEGGLALIRRALEGFAALRQRMAATNYHFCLVDALREAGRPREALDALAAAEELIAEGETVYVPLLRRAEAGAWMQLQKPRKARACLLAARDAAAEMEAWLLHSQAEAELAALGAKAAPARQIAPRPSAPKRTRAAKIPVQKRRPAPPTRNPTP